jgi:FkbM family methyltransferase
MRDAPTMGDALRKRRPCPGRWNFLRKQPLRAENPGRYQWTEILSYMIGIPLSLVVDQNAETMSASPAWSGLKVLKSNQVPESEKARSLLAVCISTAPFLPIQRELALDGWSKIVPVYDIVEEYRDRHPLSNGWFAPRFTPQDIENIRNVLSFWHDDVSRAHHLQFIAWRRLRHEWNFQGAPVDIGNRYFIPEVVRVLHQDEYFMDVGAHEGNVISRFVDLMHGKFGHIWAVEPDTVNLSMLERALHAIKEKNPRRVAVIPRAVSSSSRLARFAGGLGYASQLTALGEEETVVVTIDSLAVEPTVIKLHLEGEELAALEGAMTTIQVARPIIMTTSYHNSLGLCDLPLLLMRKLRGYRFYMRLHGWLGTAAVVYAIPEERAEIVG